VSLKKVNNILLIIIIFVNLYVALAPLIPVLIFDFQNHNGKGQQLQSIVDKPKTKKSFTNPTKVSPQPNHVVIPSMLLSDPILEGTIAQTFKTLDHGIWRWPNASSPDKGGNTVLIGHRFTYTNPRGVFYYLNKVAVGDEIAVFWNNYQYIYKVSSVNVVPPSDTAIENNTANPGLTLFTCTPLWKPVDRLVVVANLEVSP
jgi:LPXTG-site transpeptidase (sortase) family protein